MKRNVFTIIRTSLFIIFLIAAFVLSVPAHNMLKRFADSRVEGFTAGIKNKTGLTIVYKSLSPSILSNFSINQISLRDKDNLQVVQIDRAKINYSILNILKGDFQKGITNITIDGVEVELDDLLNIFGNLTKSEESADFEIASIRTIVPESIKVKNIKVDYEKEKLDTSFELKELVINNNLRKPYLGLQAEALIRGKIEQYKRPLEASISLNGILLDTIDNSYCQLKFHNITDGSVKLNKINLMLSYADKKIDLQTIQVDNPIGLAASYDFSAGDLKNGILKADFDCERISPVAIASFTGDKKLKNKLKNLFVSSKVRLEASNLFENDRSINYDFSGNVNIPSVLVDGIDSVAFDVKGNEKKVNIRKLDINGEKYTAALKLKADFKTLKLDGELENLVVILPNENILSSEIIYFEPLERSNGFKILGAVNVGAKNFSDLEIRLIPDKSDYRISLSVMDYSHNMTDDAKGEVDFDINYNAIRKNINANLSFTYMYLDSIMEYIAEFSGYELAEKIYANSEKVNKYVAMGEINLKLGNPLGLISLMTSKKTGNRTDFRSGVNDIYYEVKNIAVFDTKDSEHNQVFFNISGDEESFRLEKFTLLYGDGTKNKKNIETAQIMEYLNFNTPSSENGDNKLIRFSNAVSATGFFMFYEYRTLSWDLSLVVNSIPYNIHGDYDNGRILLTGEDYNLELGVSIQNNREVIGSVNFESLPIRIGTKTVILTARADSFSYSMENGPDVRNLFINMELDDPDVSVKPTVRMYGSISKNYADFSSITYSDLYATLGGKADVELQYENNILNIVELKLNLQNPMNLKEKIALNLTVTNKNYGKLSAGNISENFEINAKAEINEFGLDRFNSLKSHENYVTADITATGALNNLIITADVKPLSMLLASDVMKVNGKLELQGRVLSVSEVDLKYSSINVGNVNGSVSEDGGMLNGIIDAHFLDKTVNMPLLVEITDVKMNPDSRSLIPENFEITVASESLSGSFIKKNFGFALTAVKEKNILNFYSTDNLGLFGTYEWDSKKLTASVNSADNLYFNADGSLDEKNFHINLRNIKADAAKIFSYMDFDKFFIINEGRAHGELRITKSLNDPEFTGDLMIDTAEAVLPLVVPYKINAANVKCNVHNNQMDIMEAIYHVKNSKKAKMNFSLFMNKWKLDHIDGFIKSEGKDRIPARIDMGYFIATGDVAVDLTLFYERKFFELTGFVKTDKVKLASSLAKLSNYTKPEKINLYKKFNIDVLLESHASFDFDPLLRCVFSPNSTIVVDVDQRDEWYSIDGSVKIRSGDISYLNKNFFIKSGELKFVPGDLLETRLTVNAETREKDSKNQNVRIVMDVDNQKIVEKVQTIADSLEKNDYESNMKEKKSQKKNKKSKDDVKKEVPDSTEPEIVNKYSVIIEPRFSSIPMKSQNEIRQMLGEIVIADLNNSKNVVGSIAGTAGDYYIQSTVGRKIENTLREGLNFDIFSMRTNVIQNVLSTERYINENGVKLSNLLDNSTVYIGKYISDSLYLDGMLQVSTEDLNLNSLKWKPEIGLEFELPVLDFNGVKSTGAVRGAGSFTLSDVEVDFVPSITFSWKVSF